MGKVAPFGQIATYPKMPGTRKTFECPAPFGSLQRLGAALEGVLVLAAVPVDPSMLSPIDTPRLNLRSAFLGRVTAAAIELPCDVARG